MSLLLARREMPPIDQLQLFTKLIGVLGFRALYVIVDGLDEFVQTADITSDEGAALLKPLLANLTLMNDTPRLAFKLFIPLELKPAILDASQRVRRDRLDFANIEWKDEKLLEILHRRLSTSSRGHAIRSLDALSAPELRGRVERVLVDKSQQNPRFLIQLARFLVQAHCDIEWSDSASELDESAFLLNQADLERAIARFRFQVLGEREPAEVSLPLTLPTVELTAKPGTLSNYPAPIALVHLDYAQRLEPLEKAQRLLDLFEVTVDFVGIVLLSRLYALAGPKTGHRLAANRIRLERMSLGGWLAVWERVSGLCSSLKDRVYGRRFQRLYGRQEVCLEDFRQLRNQWAHGATLSEDEYNQILARFGPEMTQLLTGLRLLQETRLVQVENLRFIDDRYLHLARVYVGDNPNFPREQIEWGKPLPSERMLLLYQEDALPLYPLLVCELCPECRQSELFIYQKVEDDQVGYLSYYTGHRLSTSRHRQAVREMLGV
jgi:hypothetical protein